MSSLYTITRLLLLFLVLLVGCTPTQKDGGTPVASPDIEAALSPVPVEFTETPPPQPSPTPVTRYKLALMPEQVQIYPYPAVYAGENVSVQARPVLPDGVQPSDVMVEVWIDGNLTAAQPLSTQPLSGDAQTTLEWIWDSSGQDGEHQIELFLRPQNGLAADEARLAFTFVVQPETAVNTWQSRETTCCRVHFLSGSAAAADADMLMAAVETAVSTASRQLGEPVDDILDFYFIERMIGQGGYAGTAVVISYGERDYANIELQQLLVHESIHLIDRQFVSKRLPFLGEGVAVWGADGHYKPENLDERAAALRQIGEYVPLTTLVGDFYQTAVHEVGYLEAASFVNYLIDTYGWQRFRAFYADNGAAVSAVEGETAVLTLNTMLQTHYDMSLSEAEANWLAYLNGIDVADATAADLQTTIAFYNSLRRYQRQFDAPANFLQAWLPDPNAVREIGNPADLSRHPQEEVNVVLELMLESASHALKNGEYDRANSVISSINRVLNSDGQFIDPLALNYRDVVRQLARREYVPSHIVINGDRAEITAVGKNSPTPRLIVLRLQGNDWVFVN